MCTLYYRHFNLSMLLWKQSASRICMYLMVDHVESPFNTSGERSINKSDPASLYQYTVCDFKHTSEMYSIHILLMVCIVGQICKVVWWAISHLYKNGQCVVEQLRIQDTLLMDFILISTTVVLMMVMVFCWKILSVPERSIGRSEWFSF